MVKRYFAVEENDCSFATPNTYRFEESRHHKLSNNNPIPIFDRSILNGK